MRARRTSGERAPWMSTSRGAGAFDGQRAAGMRCGGGVHTCKVMICGRIGETMCAWMARISQGAGRPRVAIATTKAAIRAQLLPDL